MKDSPIKPNPDLKMVDTSQTPSYVQDKEVSDYSCSDCSIHSDDDNSTSSCNRDGYGEGSRRNKKKHKKKLFRALQHVVDFTTVKKLRHKRSKSQKGNDENLPPIYPRESKRLTMQDSSDNEDSRPNGDLINQRRNPSSTTIESSSSSSYYSTPIHRPYNALLSRSNSSEFSNPTEKPLRDPKHGEKEGGMAKNLIFGLVGIHVMLLISLAALVLSGKACAILCTIAWLVLLPLSRFHGRWRSRSTSSERGQ